MSIIRLYSEFTTFKIRFNRNRDEIINRRCDLVTFGMLVELIVLSKINENVFADL